MFIQIQETPNPNSLKFMPGIEVSPKNNMTFNSKEECNTSGLAAELFTIKSVVSVFLGGDFISVTKEQNSDWKLLKQEIIIKITDYLASEMPIIKSDSNVIGAPIFDHLTIEEQEIARQIIEVIDVKVKPAVAEDGGDIQFHSYKDGVVYLTMHGACAGCPSSAITLKNGIENMLQYYIPEVIRVEQI